MKKQKEKIEGIFATLAALFVLFTAMIKPIYSAILAVVFLISFALYKFVKR